MQIKTSKRAGFTLVEIMIVVAVISLLAGISTPSVLKARDTSQLDAIINNLRIIEQSKEQWAIDAKQGNGASPTAADIGPYIKGNAMPSLVLQETYNINDIGTPATATTPTKLGNIPAGGVITLP